MNSNLDYLYESLLIDELAQIELGRQKSAGLFESLNLSSAGDAIKSFVADKFKNSDEVPGGYLTSTIALMVPAVLMRINPFIGIIYLVAEQFGFDFPNMVTKLVNALKPNIESGKVSSEDVTSIGKSLFGMDASASFIDDLEMIKKMAVDIQIKKLAASPWANSPFASLFSSTAPRASGLPSIPFVSGEGSSVIQKVFGTLFNAPGGSSKIKWLLGGFAIWIVKTILGGAGLLAVGAGVASLLGHHKPAPTPYHTDHPAPAQPNMAPDQPKTFHELNNIPKPTQQSSSSNKIWIVPLVGNGTIADTLRIWTLDLYHDLQNIPGINQIILQSPLFNKMVDYLNKPNNIGNDTLVMPPEFTSRKQVVDSFIQEIKGLLNASN